MRQGHHGKPRSRSAARAATLALVLCAALGWTTTAEAKVVAIYGQAQGLLNWSNEQMDLGNDGTQPAVGLRAGARLLIFEGYIEGNRYGDEQFVRRLIVGLRGGFGIGKWRLVARGGGGIIADSGGVLDTTGRDDPELRRAGLTARVGAALERKLVPTLQLGIGAEGERYVFLSDDASDYVTGTNVLANAYLMFELGI